MTQTLRRELRKKFEDVLLELNHELVMAGVDIGALADKLADTSLEVAGIAKRTDDREAEYNAKKDNLTIDALLQMANFPGAKREARIASIQSYLGETFRRNTETKEWLAFAKYIDSEHQSKGWDVKVFVSWLFGQKDYNPQFWPVKKMMEYYPGAFVKDSGKLSQVMEKTDLQRFLEEHNAK